MKLDACPVCEDSTHILRECKLRKKFTKPGEIAQEGTSMVVGAVLFVSTRMRLTWMPAWSVTEGAFRKMSKS